MASPPGRGHWPEWYHWPVAPDLSFCSCNHGAFTQAAFENQQTPPTKGSRMPKAITGDTVPQRTGCVGTRLSCWFCLRQAVGPGGTLLLWLSASPGVTSIFPKGDGCETGDVRCDARTRRGTVMVFVAMYLVECIKIHSNRSWPFQQHFCRNAPWVVP